MDDSSGTPSLWSRFALASDFSSRSIGSCWGASRCIVIKLLLLFLRTTVATMFRRCFCLFYAWCIGQSLALPDLKASLVGSLVWSLLCVVMHATKETCVLSFAAMVAGGGVILFEPWRKAGRLVQNLLGQPSAAAWALRGWIIVALVFFSSFFTHWEGVAKALGAYFHTFDRAGGQGLKNYSAITGASSLITQRGRLLLQ